MDIEIHHRSANTAAKIAFASGDSCTAQSGAMISMSSSLEVQTSTYKRNRRGLGRGFMRMLAGESFFLNHFTAHEPSEMWLSSDLAGDMTSLTLEGEKIIVQSGSYLMNQEGIEVGVGWQGFKNLLSREGLFWLTLQGKGQALITSFGSLYQVDVDGEYVVDTGHIAAFDEGLNFSISKAGSSWLHSFMGGEGLVCRFRGKGRLWCQSHAPNSFGKALRPHLIPKKR